MKSFFSIKESWTAKLAPAAVPFFLLFSFANYLILPPALPDVLRVCLSLVFGLAIADISLFNQKREHLRRHIAEAEFLGFTWRINGGLWNPFSAPELEIEKDPSAGEQDRILAVLVRMSGPRYGVFTPVLRHGADAAAYFSVAAIVLSKFFPPLRSALVPFLGLMFLLFVMSKAEGFFERFESKRMGEEMSCHCAQGLDYIQWNFLYLEGTRLKRGNCDLMIKEIRDILLVKARLAGGARILEAGAGGGFLWKNIPEELKAGWTQVEKNVYASVYAQRHGYGTRFFNSDLKKMPFEDGSFDAIVGLECFDSLSGEDFPGFLAEAKRLLAPGGKLVHLKDYPDWPGSIIAKKFNDFSLKVIGKEAVSGGKLFPRFRFADFTGEQVSALGAAAGKEAPVDQPYAKVLVKMYSKGINSDHAFRVPMRVSVMILEEILERNGFSVLTDCLDPANEPMRMAYFVAQKSVQGGAPGK